MKFRRIVALVSLIVVIAGSIYGYTIYKDIFSENTSFSEQKVAIYIPSNAVYAEVEDSIKPYIKNMDRFRMVAAKKSYPKYIKAGKFILKRGMNSNDLVNALRQPVPVNVSFNNQETLSNAVSRIAEQVETDSTALLQSFTDPVFLEENGLTEDNVLSILIPNTYEFFWDTSARKIRERIAKEYRKFWTQERRAKAEAINLTPLEVSSLASIVHKETVKADERPRVAGVYLNRLNIGHKLEADPTVIFAMKKVSGDYQKDIKRVLYKDLVIDSPYNTYKYKGIPPGPITMPDISAIEAVLSPEKHNYLFFCASVTNFGYHEFAVTNAQHAKNAAKYKAWIDKMGIKR